MSKDNDNSLGSKWRDLAHKAANEADPKKLVQFIAELCDELDARRGDVPGTQGKKESA